MSINNNSLDHREVGKRYDLFYFDENGPGFPFWLPNGLIIKQQLIQLWREVHVKRGYQEIESPIMLDKKLWEISGHADYFMDNMYQSSVDKRDFIIKPMSCPGGMLVFNSKKRSHKELPFRMSELGHVHRNENSGSLHGLLRVRSFVQDDAHIFCNQQQLIPEIQGVIEIIESILNRCGFLDFQFELSIRGEGKKKKYLGADEDWDIAEKALFAAAKLKGYEPLIVPGEAKFYGPSLDLLIKDKNGRLWQCSTIQLDFNLPKRFDIHYFDEQGQKQIPFVLHRAIFGSLERFIGILLENYGIDLPFWLMPDQVRIIQMNDEVKDYVQQVKRQLERQNLRVSLDVVSDHLNNNVKKAQEQHIPFVLIIGSKEMQQQSLSLRGRGNLRKNNISMEEVIELMKR